MSAGECLETKRAGTLPAHIQRGLEFGLDLIVDGLKRLRS
jgi:hypothetical protein